MKRILKSLLFLLAIPFAYALVSLILSAITIDKIDKDTLCDKTIYLNTNGVHLDVILARTDISHELMDGIEKGNSAQYISYGWGDENFYLRTKTWGDLSLANAFRALFLKSSSLMHVSRYQEVRADWIKIQISNEDLEKLSEYLLKSFMMDDGGDKVLLRDKGYYNNDDFYKANGSYSCFNTCNTWLNTAFKQSGLKCCLWTPFDFGLMNKY